MEVWKIIFLSKWEICRFHVNFPGCIFHEHGMFDILDLRFMSCCLWGIAEFMIGSAEKSDRNYYCILIGWWEVKNDKIMIFQVSSAGVASRKVRRKDAALRPFDQQVSFFLAVYFFTMLAQGASRFGGETLTERVPVLQGVSSSFQDFVIFTP